MYTVRKGQKYRATISLGFLESMADNETIEKKFTDAGFIDVVVTGEDDARVAEGIWDGEDNASADIPSQVTEITAI